jgi:hypothetical protein
VQKQERRGLAQVLGSIEVAVRRRETPGRVCGTHVSEACTVEWRDSGEFVKFGELVKSNYERLWLVGEVLAWLQQVRLPVLSCRQIPAACPPELSGRESLCLPRSAPALATSRVCVSVLFASPTFCPLLPLPHQGFACLSCLHPQPSVRSFVYSGHMGHLSAPLTNPHPPVG